MSEPLLQLDQISFRYNAGDAPVLENVGLSLGAGESLAITGPSGCGKSTLLNIIGTLEKPISGRVLLQGQDLSKLDVKKLAATRNLKIGFIFQDHHLLPQCTLFENVLMPTLAGHLKDRREGPWRARDLLERVGLADRMDHRPGEVSGGQRQRAAVVRALINRPLLLLADEPTGSLDRASAESLGELLTGLNREEKTALVTVTHSQDLASKMGGTFELKDGQLERK